MAHFQSKSYPSGRAQRGSSDQLLSLEREQGMAGTSLIRIYMKNVKIISSLQLSLVGLLKDGDFWKHGKVPAGHRHVT